MARRLFIESIPAEDSMGWEHVAYWPGKLGSLVSVDVKYRENVGYTIIVHDRRCYVSVPKNYLHSRKEKALYHSKRIFNREVRDLTAKMSPSLKIVKVGDDIEVE